MSDNIRFKLVNSDGSEVKPLWCVLAAIRKYGFNTVCPVVKSGPDGSFLSTHMTYLGGTIAQGIAFCNLMEDLGPACVAPDLIPA